MALKYFRKYVTPVADAETSIYTVPQGNTSMLSSLRVTNRAASPALLTVTVYPEGGMTAYSLLSVYSLGADQTMDVFSGVSCVVQATDVLKITATEDDVDFYLSYLEMDRS
jgi:hypothetical protein